MKFLRDLDRPLFLVLGLSAAMLTLIVIKPLVFDNTLMQSMALDMFRYGRSPYTGIWIHDFPGIIYLHYFSMSIFGTSDLGLRIFDYIIQLLFTVFLYYFWRRWFTDRMAAFIALLYCAYYVSAGSLLLSERDVYGAMLIFVSVYCLIRAREAETNQYLWIVVAGLAAGAHLFMRPMAALYLALLAGSLFISDSGKVCWKAWPQALTLVAITLLPLCIFLYRLAQVPNGILEFYRQVFLWNADLYATIYNPLLFLLEEMGRRALLLPFAIFGLAICWKRRPEMLTQLPARWEKWLWGSFAISTLVIALSMRKYFSYHFAPFFMLLLPFVAIGIVAFAQRSGRLKPKVLIISAICCTFITYYPKSPVAFALALVEGKDPWIFTYNVQLSNSSWGGAREQAVVKYLTLPQNKDGEAEICSYDPHLRLHCDHEPASRYEILDALALRKNLQSDSPPDYTAYQRTWQEGYVDTLRKKSPRFIVLARGTSFMYLSDPYASCLRYLPNFDTLLATSYRYDTAFGGYQIFRIRTDSTGHFAFTVPALSDAPEPFGGIDP